MIIIIGCGFLGQYLLKEILKHTEKQVICTYYSQPPVLDFEIGNTVTFQKCDVTDKCDLQSLNLLCGGEKLIVFYLAAYHNIDAVFQNPNTAKKVNIDGLKLFLQTIENIDELYFSSTDCVYGESKSEQLPFRETDDCKPVNEYGKQKLEAENLVLERGFNVLRYSLLYGKSLCEKKNFFDKILKDLQSGQSIEMIDGLSRNAITYQKAAEYTVQLALSKQNLPPVLNVCGDSVITKYQLGLDIAQKMGVSCEKVLKISTEEGAKFFAEKRANLIELDNTNLKKIINKISKIITN